MTREEAMYGHVKRRHYRKLHPWTVRLRTSVVGLDEDIAAGDPAEVLSSLEDVWFWVGRVICDGFGAGGQLLADPEMAVALRDALTNAAMAAARARVFLLSQDGYGYVPTAVRAEAGEAALSVGLTAGTGAAAAAGSTAAATAAASAAQAAVFSFGGSAAAATAAGTSAAAASATGATGAVANLMAAAGMSATVPYAGWIVAAGAVVAAGIISLVTVGKRRRLRHAEVVKIGKAMGFPQAAAIPDFILDALSWGPHRLKREGEKIESRIKRGRGKVWEEKLKLSFIGVMIAYDLMEKRRALGLPQLPPTSAQITAVSSLAAREHIQIQQAVRSRQVLMIAIGGLGLAAAVSVMQR